MSAISTYLEYIRSKIYAKDVRTAIVNAISQCYDDVNAPALQTEAMQAAVQAKIDAGQMAALTIADGSLTGAKLANGTIPTAKIADGAVTAGKIASGVVPAVDATLTQAGSAADAKKVGGELTNLKVGLDELNGTLYLSIDESEFINGKYIWSDGKIYGNSNYTLSPYIRCAFKKIKFNCLTSGGGIQCVAFYSEENGASFIGGYENLVSLSTHPVHEMDVPVNAKYIRISKNTNSVYSANQTPYIKLTETSESILERVDGANETAQQALDEVDNLPLLSDVYHAVVDDRNLVDNTAYTLHTYVDNTGVIKTTSNTSSSSYPFCLSDYIPVESGRVIYLNNKFIVANYWAYYTENKTYLGGKNDYPAWGQSKGVCSHVVPTNAKYLRVTSSTEADAQALWASYTGAEPAGKVINASDEEYVDYHYYPTNPCDFIGRDICTFNKIVCIGDSITAGYFNHSGGGQTIAKYSYPAHLQKITGVECINMGDSGETSVSWWETYQNEDFSSYDCAIINLGINDVLLSVSEADTRSSFTNIIGALKSASTGIKIFIANINPAYSRGNTTYDAINAIIEDIATSTENCYFIDLTRYGHTVGVAYANGHLTAVGYWMLAEDYANAISYIIRSNPVAFRFVQFIGTDLHN